MPPLSVDCVGVLSGRSGRHCEARTDTGSLGITVRIKLGRILLPARSSPSGGFERCARCSRRRSAAVKRSTTSADLECVDPLVDAHSAPGDEPGLAPIWKEWGRLSRFLESARLAFARESNLWTTLELRSEKDVKLSAATAHGTYKVGLEQHLEAVRDEEVLFASVLIHSYALAETAAAERLGEDARDLGGIEDWGKQLLATTGATWDSLKEGRAGVVEVAVVRNAYAHGGRHIDDRATNRLRAAGITSPTRGELVALDYPTVKVFRGRLRALMSHGGVG